MIISCIGDSLTEGDYGIFGMSGVPNVHEENYPYFLSQILNCEVRNFGKCGYRAGNFWAYYQSGAVDVKGSDVILIMLGTNGGLKPNEEVQENVDYRSIVAACKADAPNAKIILCTPPHCTVNPAYSNCGFAPQAEEGALFVRNLAKEEGLPLLDTAICPDFTDETESVMQPNDGLHFGLVGYQTLAKFIAQEVQKLLA